MNTEQRPSADPGIMSATIRELAEKNTLDELGVRGKHEFLGMLCTAQEMLPLHEVKHGDMVYDLATDSIFCIAFGAIYMPAYMEQGYNVKFIEIYVPDIENQRIVSTDAHGNDQLISKDTYERKDLGTDLLWIPSTGRVMARLSDDPIIAARKYASLLADATHRPRHTHGFDGFNKWSAPLAVLMLHANKLYWSSMYGWTEDKIW